MTNPLIAPLFDGPIDIVGDVHGELDALRDLLRQLGYDSAGAHPDGRRLVFIGDLTDRGPDSPSVLDFVRRLVESSCAQCLLGNHELNLLLQKAKTGNGWFFDVDHDAGKGEFAGYARMPAGTQQPVLDFLATMPLILERPDLRLVHATWDPDSVSRVRESGQSAQALFQYYERSVHEAARQSGLERRAQEQKQTNEIALHNKNKQIAFLADYAELEERKQMGNPIKILTSGIERRIPNTKQPFYASGQWRMLDRIPWWNDYTDATPVIIGHYWRWPTTGTRDLYSRGEPALFSDYANNQWFGAKHNVYCVDFAVGARYKERPLKLGSPFQCRLAAVRWPERQVTFDDGATMDMV